MSAAHTDHRIFMTDEEMREFFASEDARAKTRAAIQSHDAWNTEEKAEEAIEPAHMPNERGRRICEEALKVINGERQDQYGAPEDTFKKIADLWSSYLFSGSGRVEWLTPMQVADMMCLLKIAREAGGKGKKDNAVDLLGYAMLGARMRGYDA